MKGYTSIGITWAVTPLPQYMDFPLQIYIINEYFLKQSFNLLFCKSWIVNEEETKHDNNSE